VYFYELHEADDDLFTNVLLSHDVEFNEEEFLELVLESRGRILTTFEEDSLVEAVANDLERRHGFLHIDDSRLRVSVNVSVNEDETTVSELEEGAGTSGDDEEAYRSLLVEVDPEDRN